MIGEITMVEGNLTRQPLSLKKQTELQLIVLRLMLEKMKGVKNEFRT